MNILYKKSKHLAGRSWLLLLFFVVFAGAAYAQTTSVTGRVTDENGEVMSGVMIMDKNTPNVAAFSDANGNYVLQLTSANPVLVFSYLGYVTQEIPMTQQRGRNIDVNLSQEVSMMDEVVVVGYGEQRRVSVLSAQSAVSGEALKMPSSNVSNALSGRLAGVIQVSRSGEPGREDNSIWIRGLSNFASNQSTAPLVLVDGVERDMENLDFEDIDSFTVLKDASATAVYGVRGANGVIIVTTKPGRVGKPKFSWDYYEGFTTMSKVPQMADVYTYMNAANEALANSRPDARPTFTPEYIEATKKANGLLPNDNPKFFNTYLYPAVDWRKAIFNNWGHNRRANVNIRGGVPSANYYVSLSYYNETGMTKNFQKENYDTKLSFDRFNFTSNLNLSPSTKTRVDLGFSGNLQSGHYPQVSSQDLFTRTMETNPTYLPLTMPDGSLAMFDTQGSGRNPYAELAKRGYSYQFRNTVNSNIRITQQLDWWEWSKGLSVTGMVAFDAYNLRNLNYSRMDAMYYFDGSKNTTTGLWNDDVFDAEGNYRIGWRKDADNEGRLGFNADNGSANRTTYVESSLNYNRVFGDKHRVSAMLLYNQRSHRDLTTTNMDNSLAYRNRGYAGRLTYSYDDRYLFETNVGINGSENFTPEKRYGTFPAFAVGWVASNESFFEPLTSVIQFLKFRYTYGYVGSDVVPNRRFAYQAQMGSGYGLRQSPTMDLTSGWEMQRYGVNVGWSRSLKQDFGVDIRLLNNNLSLTVDLFKEYRDRIFLQRQLLPDYAGFVESPWANLGIAENKGIEASLEYMQKLGDNASLTVRGNFTYNKSIIVENDAPAELYPWRERRGTPINAQWGYIAEGLFTSEEEIANHASQFGVVSVGDIKYRDLNEDGRIDIQDQTVIGIGDVPRVYYGFGFDLQVRNWNLGVLFQGTAQADRQISGAAIHPFATTSGIANVYYNIEDRWKPEDPTNTDVFYPRLVRMGEEGARNNTETSSWWQKDVSFLRLKQVSLSYMLPQRWMDRCFLDNASVYLLGSNLLTFSKFKLWDPELNTGNGTRYPNTTNISVGVKFSF
jgi:TonB-linked SusC/RagA family outer membrane protein